MNFLTILIELVKAANAKAGKEIYKIGNVQRKGFNTLMVYDKIKRKEIISKDFIELDTTSKEEAAKDICIHLMTMQFDNLIK